VKIIRAKVLGFCMGVRRGVRMAQEAAASGEAGAADERGGNGQTIWTLGPLIHNPQVLDQLKDRGIRILSEGNFPESLEGAMVLIRAHGVPPQMEEKLRRLGALIRDATCPRVKASQEKAAALAAAGFHLFLAGEKDHGEIIGIQGYAPGCRILGNRAEAEAEAQALREREGAVKTALIAQTTLSGEEYGAIGEAIRRWFPDLHIEDTICRATRERQEALRELCGQVDAVVVAGGRNSANTRRLLDIAHTQGKPGVLVEGPEDIPRDFGAYRTVGLSAGASTPEEVIAQIEVRLQSLGIDPP